MRSNIINIDDVLLCFSTLYWLSGVWALMRGTLFGATRIITTDDCTSEMILNFTEKYRVTYISANSFQVASMQKCEPIKFEMVSSWR